MKDSRVGGGPTAPDTPPSVDDVLLTRNTIGRYRSDESKDMELLELRRQLLGSAHPGTLMVVAKLGETWYQQGRFDGAVALLLQYLRLPRKTSGQMPPGTLLATIKLQAQYDEEQNAAPPFFRYNTTS